MKIVFVLALFWLLPSWLLADTLMIEIAVDHGHHEVVRYWKVSGNFADPVVAEEADRLKVSLWNDQQQLIKSYYVKNPLSLHDPLPLQGTGAGHGEYTLERSIYHLRIADELNVASISIDSISSAQTRSNKSQAHLLSIELN